VSDIELNWGLGRLSSGPVDGLSYWQVEQLCWAAWAHQWSQALLQQKGSAEQTAAAQGEQVASRAAPSWHSPWVQLWGGVHWEQVFSARWAHKASHAVSQQKESAAHTASAQGEQLLSRAAPG